MNNEDDTLALKYIESQQYQAEFVNLPEFLQI